MAFVPFHVKAVHGSASNQADDLQFAVGQITLVVDEEGPDWYDGQYTNHEGVKKEGIFPKKHVEQYTPLGPARPASVARRNRHAVVRVEDGLSPDVVQSQEDILVDSSAESLTSSLVPPDVTEQFLPRLRNGFVDYGALTTQQQAFLCKQAGARRRPDEHPIAGVAARNRMYARTDEQVFQANKRGVENPIRYNSIKSEATAARWVDLFESWLNEVRDHCRPSVLRLQRPIPAHCASRLAGNPVSGMSRLGIKGFLHAVKRYKITETLPPASTSPPVPTYRIISALLETRGLVGAPSDLSGGAAIGKGVQASLYTLLRDVESECFLPGHCTLVLQLTLYLVQRAW